MFLSSTHWMSLASGPCLWSTPYLGWGGGGDTVTMASGRPQLASVPELAGHTALSLPCRVSLYAGSLHEQRLDSEPLAKHSRFFGHKDFLKGPGILPGRFMPHTDGCLYLIVIYSQRYFPSILGEACLSQPGWLTGNLLADPPCTAGLRSVLPPPSVLPRGLGC